MATALTLSARPGGRSKRLTRFAASWQPKEAVADRVTATLLIAGAASLVNLFDLRPGRALKVSAVATGLIAPAAPTAAAAVAGTVIAALPSDLRETAMLGDCGATALGVALGLAASAIEPRAARQSLAAAVVALTLASERVSFTSVIESHPALHRRDELGRRS